MDIVLCIISEEGDIVDEIYLDNILPIGCNINHDMHDGFYIECSITENVYVTSEDLLIQYCEIVMTKDMWETLIKIRT